MRVPRGRKLKIVQKAFLIEAHLRVVELLSLSDLLYLVLDNMLKEDPEERSSADYIHDEASERLQRIRPTDAQGQALTSLSTTADYEDGDSTTPKPSESVESEASTFRLDAQPPSSDGLEAPIRDTVEEPDVGSDLIAGLGYRNSSLISSLCNSTDSEQEEEWERSEAPIPDTQPRQVLDTAQESMLDGLLWSSASEAAGRISHRGGNRIRCIIYERGKIEVNVLCQLSVVKIPKEWLRTNTKT